MLIVLLCVVFISLHDSSKHDSKNSVCRKNSEISAGPSKPIFLCIIYYYYYYYYFICVKSQLRRYRFCIRLTHGMQLRCRASLSCL